MSIEVRLSLYLSERSCVSVAGRSHRPDLKAGFPPLFVPPIRFWFRLYWFPLKVLYATCVSSLQSVPHIPFYFFFNALLLALLLMNIYWFLVRRSGRKHCLHVELG